MVMDFLLGLLVGALLVLAVGAVAVYEAFYAKCRRGGRPEDW